MSRYSREPNNCKVYVGDLPRDASEKEVEKAFAYYGPLKSVWVARNPPGFGFVEFEDARDADDAVRELDGSPMCGGRVRVELSSGKSRPKPWSRGGRGRGGGRSYNPDDRCYECGGRGHYAYDCNRKRGSDRGRDRRRSRSYSRSRSRSRSRGRRDNRSRSRSPQARSASRGSSHHSN